jgi:hypothetical protein
MKRAGEQRGDQRSQQTHSGLPEGAKKKCPWRVHLVWRSHFTAT